MEKEHIDTLEAIAKALEIIYLANLYQHRFKHELVHSGGNDGPEETFARSLSMSLRESAISVLDFLVFLSGRQEKGFGRKTLRILKAIAASPLKKHLSELDNKFKDLDNAITSQCRQWTELNYDGLIEQYKNIKEAERLAIRTWVAKGDYITTQNFLYSRRTESTGGWLLQDHLFQRWLEREVAIGASAVGGATQQGGHERFLWLRGDSKFSVRVLRLQ